MKRSITPKSKPYHLCREGSCKRRAVWSAKGPLKRGLCHRCYQRQWRRNHPAKAAYASLRDSAGRRNIVFTISYKEFITLASVGAYITGRGLNGSSMTVDRIDNRKGYVAGNIQFLTRSANSIKQAKHDEKRYSAGMRWQGGG